MIRINDKVAVGNSLGTITGKGFMRLKNKKRVLYKVRFANGTSQMVERNDIRKVRV